MKRLTGNRFEDLLRAFGNEPGAQLLAALEGYAWGYRHPTEELSQVPGLLIPPSRHGYPRARSWLRFARARAHLREQLVVLIGKLLESNKETARRFMVQFRRAYTQKEASDGRIIRAALLAHTISGGRSLPISEIKKAAEDVGLKVSRRHLHELARDTGAVAKGKAGRPRKIKV